MCVQSRSKGLVLLPSLSDAIDSREQGDDAAVEAALDGGANIETKGFIGETALMYAAGFGHVSTTKLLLAKGADKNAKNSNEKTALAYAKEYDKAATADLLQ